jgi:hypothetical protein
MRGVAKKLDSDELIDTRAVAAIFSTSPPFTAPGTRTS